jgi:hypothetical protein
MIERRDREKRNLELTVNVQESIGSRIRNTSNGISANRNSTSSKVNGLANVSIHHKYTMYFDEGTCPECTRILSNSDHSHLLVQRKQNRSRHILVLLNGALVLCIEIYPSNPIALLDLCGPKRWTELRQRVECDRPITQYACLVDFRENEDLLYAGPRGRRRFMICWG